MNITKINRDSVVRLRMSAACMESIANNIETGIAAESDMSNAESFSD